MEPIERLPADVAAEQMVIGSCLLDAGALMLVEPMLQPEHFFAARNGLIYTVMLALARLGKPVEMAAVASELERRGELDAAGGYPYLAELSATATPIHAGHYARVVQEMAARRRLIAAAGQATRLAYDTAQGDDLPTLAQRIMETFNAAIPEIAEDAILYWEESLGRFLAIQQEREATKDSPQFDLPWPSLSWVRPLRGGMLATVAAQDGLGKTTFAETVAEHWARARGFKVAFFHFELSHRVMLDRRQARRTRTPMAAIETGLLDERQHTAIDEMSRWPGQIQYIHCPGWPMTRVAAIARQLVRGGKADAVVVDYLGKSDITGYKGDLNTAQRRGADVETLKTMAEREGVPVLLMSQLSREASHQSRKTRHTIRDSGEVSEKSNLVILLDRDILDEDMDYSEFGYGPLTYEAGQYSPVLEIIVDKQTLGRTGKSELLFLPSFDIVELPRPSFNERVAARQKARGEDF
jgi:replicative DNA helicase